MQEITITNSAKTIASALPADFDYTDERNPINALLIMVDAFEELASQVEDMRQQFANILSALDMARMLKQ